MPLEIAPKMCPQPKYRLITGGYGKGQTGQMPHLPVQVKNLQDK